MKPRRPRLVTTRPLRGAIPLRLPVPGPALLRLTVQIGPASRLRSGRGHPPGVAGARALIMWSRCFAE